MGEINFNPEGFDAAVDNLYDAQKEIEKLRRRCDDLEKETEWQQDLIDRIEEISLAPNEYASTKMDKIRSLLNGGDDG